MHYVIEDNAPKGVGAAIRALPLDDLILNEWEPLTSEQHKKALAKQVGTEVGEFLTERDAAALAKVQEQP